MTNEAPAAGRRPGLSTPTMKGTKTVSEKPMFMRGYALESVHLGPNDRLLAIELGYSPRQSGKYRKMKVAMPIEGAKQLARELAELAEELGATHH